jgi:spore germination protein KC
MHKKFLILLLLLPLILTGCWDRTEINDIAFVVATGVDKEKDKFRTTFQIPLPSQLGGAGSKGGGGGSSGDKSYYLDSRLGGSLEQTFSSEQEALPRYLNFSHRSVLVLGNEMAKDGIENILDVAARNPVNRLTTFLVVAKGTARDLLNADAPLEKFPAEAVREIVQRATKKPYTLKQFMQDLLSPGKDPIAPVFSVINTKPGSKGKPKTTVKLSGFSIFNSEKAVGTLTGEKATGLLIAMDLAPNPSTIIVQPPGQTGKISLQINESKTQLKPYINNNKLAMNIVFRTRATVVENTSSYNITEKKENFVELEHWVNNEIKRRVEQVIDELQHTYHSDPMGFGKTFHQKYPKEWKTMEKDWKTHLSQVKVSVEPRVHIEQFGTLISSPVRKERDLH